MSNLELTPTELSGIVDRLAPGFDACVKNYDASKYPADAYDSLVAAFSLPATVTGGDIRRALEWKYGHWVKAD